LKGVKMAKVGEGWMCGGGEKVGSKRGGGGAQKAQVVKLVISSLGTRQKARGGQK